MSLTRRDFLGASAGTAAVLSAAAWSPGAEEGTGPLILDTHQHLWNRSRLNLPWLESAPAVLQQNYGPEEYAAATRGRRIRAIYMEVDVAPRDHELEADYVVQLCRSGTTPTAAAVIGGRPALRGFEEYARRYQQTGYVRGIRQVLHTDSTPPGFCLEEAFVQGLRQLAGLELTFDLCMRPKELRDAARLSEECPDTRFVLDHCGNADPKAFLRRLPANSEPPTHDPEQWRRDIDLLAKRPNVDCKISGIVARAPQGWTPEVLAPIVMHCLDSFGPDRVVFGGDWPVCLLGSSLGGWIDALAQLIANRPEDEQKKLWSLNAARIYRLR